MRPLGTQRPERPKSELWHKKYEKCGLSKACDAHAYARATAGTLAMPEKAVQQLDLGRFTWGDSEFPTIRSAAVLQCAACIDSPHGLGGARSMIQRIQARSWWKSAEISRAVWCYDRLQA
jgi:hypothetical protein